MFVDKSLFVFLFVDDHCLLCCLFKLLEYWKATTLFWTWYWTDAQSSFKVKTACKSLLDSLVIKLYPQILRIPSSWRRTREIWDWWCAEGLRWCWCVHRTAWSRFRTLSSSQKLSKPLLSKEKNHLPIAGDVHAKFKGTGRREWGVSFPFVDRTACKRDH